MASATDTVSNLALLGIVGVLGFVLLRFQEPLEDFGRGAGDVVSGTVEFVEDTAGVFTPAGSTGNFEVSDVGQSSGGSRLETAGRTGDWVRNNVTGPVFGAADPGFVRRDDEIVAVDEFGDEVEGVDTLTPGDEFGDVRYTGTGF